MNEQTEKVMFGFWIYLMTDCVLFAGLFAVYAVLHVATAGTGTAEALFNLPFVLTETVILLTSSFTAGLALLNARASQPLNEGKTWPSLPAQAGGPERTRAVAGWLMLTLVLGIAFLSMELSEFLRLIHEGFGPSHSAFLSSFFTLVGTHGLHVALGTLWMLVLGAHIYTKGLTPDTTRKLALWSLFWHFLDVVWIFIFTFVYLWSVL